MLLSAVGAFAQDATNDQPFDIQASDITWGDCKVTITPKDPNAKYVWGMRNVDYINKYWTDSEADPLDQLYQRDYDWYNNLADMYGGTVYDQWETELVQGVFEGRTGTSDVVRWGHDIVVYAYTIDSDAKLSSPVVKKIVTTTMPKKSDITFDVTINKEGSNGVNATITPSNDELYFVDVQRKRFLDWYDQNGVPRDSAAFSLLELAWKSTEPYGEENVMQRLHTGSYTIKQDDYGLFSGQNYQIIVFGYNNGASTEIQTFDFNTLRSPSSAFLKLSDYFLDEDGNPDPEVLTSAGNGVWNYVLTADETPQSIWYYITNATIDESKDTYHYEYNENQGTTALKMVLDGVKNPNDSGVYATLDLTNDDLAEAGITEIRFVNASTGISTINGNEVKTDNAVYTIDGRKVANGNAQLQKGMYITNGKKFVVK